MAKNKGNNEYRARNEAFMQALRDGEEELYEISQGVLCKIHERGTGERCPRGNDVVTVHYKGTLINGKVFDQTQKGRPATFRLGELITGWNTALREMPAGSRWEIVIPYHLGYGSRSVGAIKAFSTLIFDITLLDVK